MWPTCFSSLDPQHTCCCLHELCKVAHSSCQAYIVCSLSFADVQVKGEDLCFTKTVCFHKLLLSKLATKLLMKHGLNSYANGDTSATLSSMILPVALIHYIYMTSMTVKTVSGVGKLWTCKTTICQRLPSKARRMQLLEPTPRRRIMITGQK